jgi:lysophospholipase L1-like esterase
VPNRRVVVLVLVVIAVLVGGAVPAHAAASGQAKGKRTALLIGDSVMAALNPNYTDAARKVIGGAGWNVTIDAKVNRTTVQGVAVVRAHKAQLGDTVVVMLGQNDGGTPALFATRAQKVMAALAQVPHVYWLTMRLPAYSGADQVLRTLTTTYRNLKLIDWAHAVRPGWTGKDGLHLSGAGATGMARLIVASIK